MDHSIGATSVYHFFVMYDCLLCGLYCCLPSSLLLPQNEKELNISNEYFGGKISRLMSASRLSEKESKSKN